MYNNSEIRNNLRCSHCGNVTPHSVIVTHKIYEEEPEGFGATGIYYVAVCATCNEISLHLCMDYEAPNQEIAFKHACQIYPKLKLLPDKIVPKDIIKHIMKQ